MRLRTLLLTLFLCASTIGAVAHDRARANNNESSKDSVELRFPVSPISPKSIKDLNSRPLDLRTPSNIVTDTIYNLKDSTYSLSTRLGDDPLGTPISLSQDEYSGWKFRQSMQKFFRQKKNLRLKRWSRQLSRSQNFRRHL